MTKPVTFRVNLESMEDILLLHRSSKTSLDVAHPVWKTCLRQVAFLQGADDVPELGFEDEVLRGDAALRFLVEVLSGLHSPILGETEVFGQFRLFADSQKDHPLFSASSRWLRFVFHEVKEMRARHLCGMGAHSYGSLLRKRLQGAGSVSICGAGHLAREILPWILPDRDVQIFSRSGADDLIADRVVVDGYQAPLKGEVLVVAAPISDEAISKIVSGASVPVFDLRGEANSIRRVIPHAVTLQDLFSELDSLRRSQGEKIATIKEEISRRVAREMNRPECRPLGWDDICA